MATTPESHETSRTNATNDDLLSRFQKLQDDHVGLQQILRNRVLPQQETADELISEAIVKCRFVFSKKILEVKTEMKEMTRRIDDLADSFEKELTDLETMVESLRAEQKRMKSSLPPDVLPLPSLMTWNRRSSTPKLVNSPKVIRKKENLPPISLPPPLQKIDVVQKKPETLKTDKSPSLQNIQKESTIFESLPNAAQNLENKKPEELAKLEPEVSEANILQEDANLASEASTNSGEKIKRRPSLAEALWEKMTSPNVALPMIPSEIKKSNPKTSLLPTDVDSKQSPEFQNQLTSNVTSRNKRNAEQDNTEPLSKKLKESETQSFSPNLFLSPSSEEEETSSQKTITESFVKPLHSSDLLMTKVFPQTAKSPALSLIPEESTTASAAATPAPARRRGRQSRPQVSAKSESKSRSVSPTSEDNSEISDTDLASGGRKSRRAAAQIKSFKEPSLNTKMRQPRKKK